MQRTISPEALSERIEADGHAITVIDVRKANDYAEDPVVIPGAQRRLPETVDDWLKGIASEREVIVYCVHGHAVSSGVLDRLLAAGRRARMIEGGIEAWKAIGGATVAGPS